jgi:bifunctional non-homologous end joining protein LigD
VTVGSSEVIARRPDGIFVSDFEQGEIGPIPQGVRVGFQGLVSKRRDRSLSGWTVEAPIKIKNRKHPAMSRVMEAFRL